MLSQKARQYPVSILKKSFFISAFLIHIIIPVRGHAQTAITSDGTLNTTVTFDQGNYTIGDGTIKGNNQFHSFGRFNVPTDESATFTGPQTIENIIGRVTGGEVSEIDGRISSEIDGADLFLVNPTGILFGPNATLDVKGSFHASTADFVRLSDGGIFYADPGGNSTLTVASPASFGFLDGNPAGITIQGSALEVPEGKTLSVVGGDVEIMGDSNFASASLTALRGQINIASTASPGEVIPNAPGETPDIQAESLEKLGEIVLTQGALINAGGDSGGTIVIRGGRLMIDNAFVLAHTTGDVDGSSTAIDIDVTDSLTILHGGGLGANSYGAGDAGDIKIAAGGIKMLGVLQTPSYSSSFIGSMVMASGDSGDIRIDAGNLEIRDASVISTTSWNSQGGNAGNLEVIADSVLIAGPESSPDPFTTDFTGMDTSSGWAAGNGGELSITTDNLTMTNRASLDGSAYGPGRGGDMTINAGNVEVLKGSAIIASAFGSGDGGNCTVTADQVFISGVSPEIFTDITGTQSLSPSGIASQTGLNGGSAGGVKIVADSLEISDGGRLSVETFGPGDGGSVEVEAGNVRISGVNPDLRDLLISNEANPKYAAASILSGSGSFYLGDGATGQGGNIKIVAENIELSDGALISSETETPGDGGYIEIEADNVALASGASIASESRVAFATITGKAGNISITANETFSSDGSSVTTAAELAEGGDITIKSRETYLANNSLISAESSGPGDAGNITLTATDMFNMKDSSLTTEAKQADGGNIKINSDYMVHLVGSEITATVGGGPETVGGNINIDPEFVVLDNSKIIANAFAGRGGNIRIVAGTFLADPNSIVDASSAKGIDGTVEIRAPVKDISQKLKPLPRNVLRARDLIYEPCMARLYEGEYSSFVVSGRDGLPLEPGGLLPSPLQLQ
jgi:filamentous hemagglutinin family protein